MPKDENEKMSEQKAALLEATLEDAFTQTGWRKIIVGCTPAGIRNLTNWLVTIRGRSYPQSPNDILKETVAEGTRRVVIFIEPDISQEGN